LAFFIDLGVCRIILILGCLLFTSRKYCHENQKHNFQKDCPGRNSDCFLFISLGLWDWSAELFPGNQENVTFIGTRRDENDQAEFCL